MIRFGLAECAQVRDLNPPANAADGFAFMVNDFVPRVRWLFDKGGFTRKDDGQEMAGHFLVAWSNQLFYVHSDLQVGDPLDDYTACGCGSDLVLGSLFSTARLHHLLNVGSPLTTSPIDRVRMALEAAEQFSAGVRSPFTVLSTKE